MATFKMGNKSFVTQSGDDEPVVASNVDFSSATFPAGHVLQTLAVTTSTQRTTTSTGWITSPDITLDITTTGSNKVFISLCAGLSSKKTTGENANSRTAGGWGLMRGSTHLVEQDICHDNGGHGATTTYGYTANDSASIVYLDSPGAGTHTYAMIFGKAPSASWTITQSFRVYVSASYPQCSMVLQEIKA